MCIKEPAARASNTLRTFPDASPRMKYDTTAPTGVATATSNDPHAITIGVFRGTTAGCDLDIQQVRLFNRPLTDAEVAILYDEEM